MTTTTITNHHETIVGRANEELAQLAERRSFAMQLIAESQQDLSDLTARCTEAQRNYDAAMAPLATAQDAVQRAETWAELAHGTPAEATALSQLKEARTHEKVAQKAVRVARLALEAAQADQESRSPALHHSIDENRALVAELDQKIASIQAAREVAHAALGQETYEHVTQQLAALSQQIASEGRDLIDTKLALSAAREAAHAALSPWPSLVEQAMKDYGVFEDATTRVLAAYLAFLDVLVADGPAMPWRIAGYSPALQVEITGGFVEAIMQGRAEQELTNRRYGAKKMLEMHLASVGQAGNPLA